VTGYRPTARGQSHVVGVVLVLGLSVIALGALTVGVGEVIDAQTATADATRVADEMDSALQPAEVTGPHSGRLQFADGRLRTERRDLRVLRNGSVVADRQVDALVYESGQRRVAFLAGAIVQSSADSHWLHSDPSVGASGRNEVVVVGAPVLEAGDVAVSGSGHTTVTLDTNVTHDRRDLGRGEYAVAIETTTPGPFERHFEAQNATTARRDLDGDGTESVVATYPGIRRGFLATHTLALEVTHG
jgi:hypothetical protein